jgi:uncharacterized protein (TIGR02466 family)
MVDGSPHQHPEPQPEDGLRHVFPTPIWTFTFPRAEVVNPSLRQVILEAAQTYPSHGRSNVGGWRSRNDLFHWEAPEVKDIGAWIMDCVRQIVEATAAPERFRGTISVVGWASVCRTGNYNAPHVHPDSAWSGVYYVDTGEPDETMPLGSCLELLDPRSAAGGVNTPGDPFGHPVQISPRAGQLTVFPSWLTHWVHPHSGRRERIAISFNVAAKSEDVVIPSE